jgi:hypothetical protein
MALPDQSDLNSVTKPAEETEGAGNAEQGKLEIDRTLLFPGNRLITSVSVEELQSRVEAAFKPAPTTSEPIAIPAEDREPERWSPRVQFAVIFGGSALGWALILTPFLAF